MTVRNPVLSGEEGSPTVPQSLSQQEEGTDPARDLPEMVTSEATTTASNKIPLGSMSAPENEVMQERQKLEESSNKNASVGDELDMEKRVAVHAIDVKATSAQDGAIGDGVEESTMSLPCYEPCCIRCCGERYRDAFGFCCCCCVECADEVSRATTCPEAVAIILCWPCICCVCTIANGSNYDD